jgi:branched-chain amino acid transport system permease protein
VLLALFEQIINGLMMGSLYVLVALGLVLIYGVMHVVNFAHGVLFMLGGYAGYFFFSTLVASYPLAIVFSVLALMVVGLAVERLVFKPLRDNVLNQVIAALGLILFIQNGVIVLWGPTAKNFSVEATAGTLRIGELGFTWQHVLIVAVTFASVGLLYLFLTRTRLGTAIRATSQNRDAAAVVGINVDRLYTLTFLLGCGLAALGGALLGPLFLVYPAMGDLPLLKALAAILLGGMGSVPGAVGGGLLIGVTESVATLFIPTDYRDTITFLIIIGILLLRPQGLFGSKVRGEA